jgi:hypothetical protein
LPELGVNPGVEMAGGAADAATEGDAGVKIILSTSSRDISAASIAAQSPSFLLLEVPASVASAIP